MEFHPNGRGVFVAHELVARLNRVAGDGPKGTMTIRADDHAMLQPMFQARLVEKDGAWVPELIDVVDADAVAPPVAG